MKKYIYKNRFSTYLSGLCVLFISFALSVLLFSCASVNQREAAEYRSLADHSSKNTLDWDGLYWGVVPAADSPGIDVRIALNRDETYNVRYQYLGRNDVFVFTGYFIWDDLGETIILDDDSLPRYYKVGENTLLQLDMQGNRITGELADKYILVKISN